MAQSLFPAVGLRRERHRGHRGEPRPGLMVGSRWRCAPLRSFSSYTSRVPMPIAGEGSAAAAAPVPGICGRLYEWMKLYRLQFKPNTLFGSQLLRGGNNFFAGESKSRSRSRAWSSRTFNFSVTTAKIVSNGTPDLSSWIIFFFHHQHVQFAKEIPFPLVKFTRRENPGLKNICW